MNFCSYVLLSKKSKHPLNIARANDSVIPGKDQGTYLNDNTNACDKSEKHILQASSSDSWSKPGMTT